MVKEKYVKIPVELLEALCRLNLSPYESRVFHAVARKTFGWHREKVNLNVSKLAKEIGLHRQHVQRALKSLSERGILNITRHDQKGIFVGIEQNTKYWLERAPLQGALDFK